MSFPSDSTSAHVEPDLLPSPLTGIYLQDLRNLDIYPDFVSPRIPEAVQHHLPPLPSCLSSGASLINVDKATQHAQMYVPRASPLLMPNTILTAVPVSSPPASEKSAFSRRSARGSAPFRPKPSPSSSASSFGLLLPTSLPVSVLYRLLKREFKVADHSCCLFCRPGSNRHASMISFLLQTPKHDFSKFLFFLVTNTSTPHLGTCSAFSQDYLTHLSPFAHTFKTLTTPTHQSPQFYFISPSRSFPPVSYLTI